MIPIEFPDSRHKQDDASLKMHKAVINNKPYKIHLLVAVMLKSLQKYHAAPIGLPRNANTDLPCAELDCALSTREHPNISLFSVCSEKQHVAKMIELFMLIPDYTASALSIEYMEKNPALRPHLRLIGCIPRDPYTLTYQEPQWLIAEHYIFRKAARSASVLRLMTNDNLISLSLWALFASTEKKQPLSNKEYLLNKDELIAELSQKTSFANLAEPFRSMILLLQNTTLNTLHHEQTKAEDIERLFKEIAPVEINEQEHCVPSQLRRKILCQLAAHYPQYVLERAVYETDTSALHDELLFEKLFSRLPEFAHKLIVQLLMQGYRLPIEFLKNVDLNMLQREVNQLPFTPAQRSQQAALYNYLVNEKYSEVFHAVFLAGLSILNDRNALASFIETPIGTKRSLKPLHTYLSNQREFIPYLIELVQRGVTLTALDIPPMRKSQGKRLLHSSVFEQASRKDKLNLICFYGELFQPAQLQQLSDIVGSLSLSNLEDIINSLEALNFNHNRLAGFLALLNSNVLLGNQLYLASLKDRRYMHRVKWLHLAGFRPNLDHIEDQIAQTRITRQELLEVMYVLQEVARITNTLAKPPKMLFALDSLFQQSLINLFEQYQSRISAHLPKADEMSSFEHCVMALFYKLNIARNNQSIVIFCSELQSKKPEYKQLSHIEIIKSELNHILETATNERVILNWLVIANQDVYTTVLNIYAWQVHNSAYAIASANQLHDMLSQSLNASATERNAAATSLASQQQLGLLTQKVNDLQTQLSSLQTLLETQHQLLVEFVKHKEARSSTVEQTATIPGFFGTKAPPL